MTSLHNTHFDPLGDVVPENILNFQASSENKPTLLSGLRHLSASSLTSANPSSTPRISSPASFVDSFTLPRPSTLGTLSVPFLAFLTFETLCVFE